MQEEYGDKGLTVLAVTSEPSKPTEQWVKDKGARYAYAYDKGGKLMRELGCKGWPSAVLIDPSGTIAWKGHPGSLTGADIEPTLAGALPVPLYEWPREARNVRRAVQKSQYAKALKEAQKLDDPEQMVGIVRGIVDGQMGALEDSRERGDYLKAYGLAQALRTSLKGLPEVDRAKLIYEEIKGDKQAQAVIKAQKSVQKLADKSLELRKKKDAEALIEKCRKISRDHSGTYACEQALSLADRIQKKIPTLR